MWLHSFLHFQLPENSHFTDNYISDKTTRNSLPKWFFQSCLFLLFFLRLTQRHANLEPVKILLPMFDEELSKSKTSYTIFYSIKYWVFHQSFLPSQKQSFSKKYLEIHYRNDFFQSCLFLLFFLRLTQRNVDLLSWSGSFDLVTQGNNSSKRGKNLDPLAFTRCLQIGKIHVLNLYIRH